MCWSAYDHFEITAFLVTAIGVLEALPQHEGKEADEDMSLHAVLALMPDRADVQLILLDAKRRFGLGELDVGLPELLNRAATSTAAIFYQAMRSWLTGRSRSHSSSRPVPRHSASPRYTSPNRRERWM
jgi:hypothetical protein